MMIPRPSPSRRSARYYILAAVVAVLVAIAIVAAISISLSPAHISFSVANATLSYSSHTYNLTITANNTSRRRAEVAYDLMTAEIWSSQTTSFPKEISINQSLRAGQRQGPRSSVTFHVDIDYKQYDMTSDNSTDSENDRDCKVVVVAKVRFWIGHLPTKPYTVRGTCMHVNFLYNNASYFPVNCGMY
ncbi:hypothetical protein HU200_011858 [Digitaria exilis]|uniref:Late embryogenesis abundant protein LEA-2 subgroup domain-containing protein n=1 Tax=Digitaria exilis TaxID=1010633 RepID=A0A835FGG7_9POAL|nr:hypothetical protein HU200_052461 [Digitaria exilis]KAF8752747.1 hypothetical protein HU200_011858 [Digitaria exilis]